MLLGPLTGPDRQRENTRAKGGMTWGQQGWGWGAESQESGKLGCMAGWPGSGRNGCLSLAQAGGAVGDVGELLLGTLQCRAQ